jgi:type II secretory pathway component HofQ
LPEYQINAEIGQIKLGEQFVIPTEVKNGETLIIGGMTRNTYSDNRSKNHMLPIFGDGRDKQQRRRETIVVLTAYLSD